MKELVVSFSCIVWLVVDSLRADPLHIWCSPMMKEIVCVDKVREKRVEKGKKTKRKNTIRKSGIKDVLGHKKGCWVYMSMISRARNVDSFIWLLAHRCNTHTIRYPNFFLAKSFFFVFVFVCFALLFSIHWMTHLLSICDFHSFTWVSSVFFNSAESRIKWQNNAVRTMCWVLRFLNWLSFSF